MRQLAGRLGLFGIKAWIDEMEILPGDSLIGKIEHGLKSNDYVGAVLSSRSISSEWVTREIRAALSGEIAYQRVIILPMIIEDCDIPPFLQDKLYANFRSDFHIGFSALLRRLLGNGFFEKATIDDLRTWTTLQTIYDPLEKFHSYVRNQTAIRERQLELEQFRQAVLQTSIDDLVAQLSSEARCEYILRLAEAFHQMYICYQCGAKIVNEQKLAKEIMSHHIDTVQSKRIKPKLLYDLQFDGCIRESDKAGLFWICEDCLYREGIKTTD